MSYEKVNKRVQRAQKTKQQWKGYIDELYAFFLPEKNLSTPTASKVNLFDSTTTDAISDYASRMESSLVPAGRRWMKLEAGSEIPKEEEHQVNQKLEDMTTVLFNNINSSNFSSQINECFLDLGISTGAIIVEQGDGIQSSLRFRSVPLQDLILERSEKGIVETVFREITIPYLDLKGLFPDADELPNDYLIKYKQNPSLDITLIEGVMKTESLVSPYRSVLLFPEGKVFLRDQKLESSPWIVFREATTSGETFGRGRAMRCLADAKTLNKVMEYYIDTCELLGNPIYTAVDDGIINPATIVVRPKTIIPVQSADSIRPLAQSGNPELNMDLMSRLQDSIRRAMLSKPFGKIDETPVRSATEMSIRNADLASTAGAASGRIQTELLERLISRCVFVLKQVGKIADFRVNGKEVKIKFTSPSARQQDEIDLATTLRFLDTLQAFPPEMIEQTVKVEDVPKYIAEQLGVSANLIRSPQEREAKEAEQQEKQIQMMQAEAQAKGQPNV